jgi:hypothetical protein
MVFLELRQGARIDIVSGQMKSVQEDIADVKQDVTAMINILHQMLNEGAKQRARDLEEKENLRRQTAELKQDTEVRSLKLWQDYEQLREENVRLKQRGGHALLFTDHQYATILIARLTRGLSAQENEAQVGTILNLQPPMTSHQWMSVYPPFPMYANFDTSYIIPAQGIRPTESNGLLVLIELLQAQDVHRIDVEAVKDSSDALSTAHRSLVSQLLGNEKFNRWARAVGSRRLLIEDDEWADPEAGSPLSWFSSILVKTVLSRVDFIPVVFFCGQHTESDDIYTGVQPLMRSLLTQLAEQKIHKFGATLDHPMPGFHEQGLTLPDLLRIFHLIARQLPPSAVLVCILDGVNHYENARHEGDLLYVLEFLTGLTEDSSIPPAVKVLATSATKTVCVHKLFQNEDEDDGSALISITELLVVANEVDEADMDVTWADSDI